MLTWLQRLDAKSALPTKVDAISQLVDLEAELGWSALTSTEIIERITSLGSQEEKPGWLRRLKSDDVKRLIF